MNTGPSFLATVVGAAATVVRRHTTVRTVVRAIDDLPNARSQLVETAIRHLSVQGPSGVQPQEVCRELGLSKALVNYHFGGRDGLILEAMATAYDEYVELLSAAADAAGDDPVDRLFAWIDRQVEWTSANPGVAAALDFPGLVGGAGAHPEAEQRLVAAGTRNFANLQTLVRAARAHLLGVADPADLDAAEVGLTGAVIGWLTLGMSVWVGGNHLPTRQAGKRTFLPHARAHVRTMVTEMLSRP
jgi:AcrR family transcriptional regulator